MPRSSECASLLLSRVGSRNNVFVRIHDTVGVYLEKVLKQSSVNVWMQNIRLASFGFFVSLFSMWMNDYERIQAGNASCACGAWKVSSRPGSLKCSDGFLRGFDATVWVMTFTNSAGGLLIAIVMKYADNIVKAYAQVCTKCQTCRPLLTFQSAAIIGAAVGSWLLFDFSPNIMFLIGTLLVACSVYLYNAYPYRPLAPLSKAVEVADPVEPIVIRTRG